MIDSTQVALASIALAGALATGFFALVSRQDKTHQRIADSLEKVAQSNKEIAKATEKGSKEAKERNGHLAEITIQQADKIVALIDNHEGNAQTKRKN